jgi:myosin I
MNIGEIEKTESVYSGRKYRRKESLGREYIGDYLRLDNSAKLRNLLKKNGDEKLLFSGEINKINHKSKNQKRLLLVTDKAIYNVEPNQFKVQRRIPIEDVDGVSVSSLTDGYFCLHM